MILFRSIRLAVSGVLALLPLAPANAQINPAVIHAATASPLVRASFAYLVAEARLITARALRAETLDAITNANTCVQHRRNVDAAGRAAVIAQLIRDSLLVRRDSATNAAGVFPPLRDDGADCPMLLQTFAVSAGGNGGHHDYPGGLPVHEAYNLRGALLLAELNRSMYLAPASAPTPAPPQHLDIVRAAVIWHDWAKTLVLQWRPDGTLTSEVEIAGTGAHHILGLAEAMARGLPAVDLLAQASSHAAPGLRDNVQIVRWIRAAAIIAHRDPVERGYLIRASDGEYLLAAIAAADGDSLVRAHPIPFSAFPEAALVNVSDDNLFSIAATAQVESILASPAPGFGYSDTNVASYRNNFRNPVLSYVGADRLALLFRDGGRAAVRRELTRLRVRGVFVPARAGNE